MAYTAPRTWVVNEIVTASLLNTHLRDNLKSLQAFEMDTTTVDQTGTTAFDLVNLTLPAGITTGHVVEIEAFGDVRLNTGDSLNDPLIGFYIGSTTIESSALDLSTGSNRYPWWLKWRIIGKGSASQVHYIDFSVGNANGDITTTRSGEAWASGSTFRRQGIMAKFTSEDLSTAKVVRMNHDGVVNDAGTGAKCFAAYGKVVTAP